MKKNLLLKGLAAMLLFIVLASCGTMQTTAEKQVAAEELGAAIEDFEFVFKANYAHPSGYRGIYLSPGFNAVISKDGLKVYLPYYGRSYSAPLNLRGGGIDFESDNFEYDVRRGKEPGNWHVDIRAKEKQNEYFLYFNIWENGRTSLNVSDMRRQSISFRGVTTVKKKE